MNNDEPVKHIYSRVSTTEQNVDQQTALLTERYGDDCQVWEEKASGKNSDREQFQAMQSELKEGDTVIAYDISRLGRNVVDVLQFVEEMTDRKIHIVIDTLGSLDITSSTGKMVLTTLASVAEMQRSELLEKQRIGIERAKQEGKYKGKQQSPDTLRKCKAALADIDKGLSKEKAAKANGVGIATLYRYIKTIS
jgi:DNA invertase Pin-like site-specific DNA recombinase